MVSPLSNTFSGNLIGGNTNSSRQNPNNQRFTFRSYAQTSRKQFLEATAKNSIVIATSEFNGMSFKDKSLNKHLRDQYHNGFGLRTRNIGQKQHFIEINFRTYKEREEALNKEFILHDRRIQVDCTFEKNSTIVSVGISNIPFEDEELLKPQLIEIFQGYGGILEIGLRHTTDGYWFTGKGFVTLNQKKNVSYKALSPQIPGWDDDCTLHLVYSNMRPMCNYCHVDDHIKANCLVLNSRKKSCYQCGSTKHLGAECPLAPWNHKRKVAKPSPVVSYQAKPMTVSIQDFMGDIEGNTKSLTEAEPTVISVPSEADEEVLEQEKQDQLKDEEVQEKEGTVERVETEDVISDELMQEFEKEGCILLNYKSQAYQPIWTTKCGFMNNNKRLQMDHVKTSDDNCILLAKFTIIGEADIQPFYILSIYALASNIDNARIRFFQSLVDFIDSLDSPLDIMFNMIVVGDFNFSFKPTHLSGSRSSRPKKFMFFMTANLSDCLNSKDDDDFYNYIPTFRQGKSMSCINYIFAGGNIRRYVYGGELEFLSPTHLFGL
ncbi:uncharacterized protein B0P05DRAFT_598364 [Gilbertella persicaria]|uniref:uncharacterized protein n=1 Tax=Gilbertella persicaria TaxID=101096 RepID=UPI00221F3787|nr:uncharacterized protein B0P05DRAFT_598364 [Gilbertella persicaria]KAI8070607.1 hypothetical protein B0P05DRAFT_598364 [Gilbertella persicaria]